MEVEQIKSLVELMKENDLSEIMLRDGETRLVLRRGAVCAVPQLAAMPMAAPAVTTAPAAPAGVPAAGKAADPDAGLVAIKSPMVGTFYSASKPGAPSFVQVGSTVGPESVVCIIEAMKVFNEIKAEVSGTVERVVASNGGPVEFGQTLFLVRPS